MQVYTVDEVLVPHSELRGLRQQGKLNLGIANQDAMALLMRTSPTKIPENLAVHLATWFAFGVFGVSVYYSFTSSWWWFIPGFIAMRMIWKAAKAALPDGYLAAAMVDKKFYEDGWAKGVWLYQMHPEDAQRYRVG